MNQSFLSKVNSKEKWLGFLILPILLFALNFTIKFVHLDTVQVGMDEPFTLFHAQMPPSTLLKTLSNYNNPPLMELVLHGWTTVFGTSVKAVRMPSLLFSCLTAVFLFWLGRRVYDWKAGLLASLAFTFTTWNIYFAHEARVYALFSLLTIVSLYGLLLLREKSDSWLRFSLLLFVNILLVYSHYFGFIVIAWECLWVLLVKHPNRKQMLIRFGIAIVVLVLAYLPQFSIFFQRFGDASGTHWVAKSSFPEIFNTASKFMNQPVTAVVCLGLMFAAGIKWLVLWAKGKELLKPDVFLLFGLFPGGYLLLWAVGWKIPVFLDRYTVFAMVGLYLVLGISIVYLLKHKWVQLSLGIIVLALFAATTQLAYDPGSEWKEVATKIQTVKGPADAVLLSPWWNHLAFIYHFDQDIFQDHAHLHARMESANIWGFMAETPLSKLKLRDAPAIWVASVGEAPFHSSLDSLIKTDYIPAAPIEGNYGISIQGFRKK